MAEINVAGTGYRRFYFSGTAGDSYAGDIAIDDISFRKCELEKLCPDSQFTCEVAQCIDTDKVCDFKQTCQDGSDEAVCGTCDFEKGGCGWVNDDSADFYWSYAQGASYTWDNMPSTDHTTETKAGWIAVLTVFIAVFEYYFVLVSINIKHYYSTCLCE